MNTIIAAVAETACREPERLCVADTKRSLTYGEFWRAAAGFAAFLSEKGVQPEDRVVIRNSQNTEFIAAVLAVQLLGAVSVPLEKNVAEARIRETLEETGAVCLLAGKDIGSPVPFLPVTEVLKHPADDTVLEQMYRRAEKIPEEWTAEILFTTGTTGKSKGIELNHRAVTAVAENVIDGVEMKPDNVELIPVPLSHSHGLRRLYANLLNGSSAVLLDGVVFVNAVFSLIEKYRVTALDLVPAALTALLRLSGDRLGDFRDQIDYIQLGSAPIPEEDRRHLCRLLPESRLYNFYGTTESGCSCIVDFNDGTERKNCIGRPTRHAEFAFLSGDGQPIAATPENPGLLACRGAMNMTGYYHSPEQNREVFRGEYIVTQDLAYPGADGMIYLLGRQGDVISSGGIKISPQEIEDAAAEIPGMRDCACIPEPDAILGQRPCLFYAAEPELTEQQIFDELMRRLEANKVPKDYRRVDAVPRTFNGKIRRNELAAMLQAENTK